MSDELAPFGAEVLIGDDAVTLRVWGDIDLAAGPLLDERLRTVTEGAAGDVLVDLSRVWFLDSAALRVLIIRQRRLQAAGRRLMVIDASPSVRRLFDVSGLTERFNVGASNAVAAD